MVDITSIAAVTSSLNAAVNVAKAAIGLRDAEAMRAKVIELQGEISSALGGAVSAQMHQLTLIESVRNLEGKIAELEAWSSKKQRYELHSWDIGVFTYRLKSDVQPSEAANHLCANCYDQGAPSVLQRNDDFHYERLECPRCKTMLKTKVIRRDYSAWSGRTTRL